MSAGQHARALLAVIGSVAAFALLVERTGLPVAVLVATLIASAGAGRLSLRVALPYAAVLALVITLLFVGGLAQPIPVWPWP